MKVRQYTEEQIVAVLREGQAGAKASDQVENCATVRYDNDVGPGNDQGCVSTVVTPPGAAG
ncbi:MAG: hypothetical protein HW388_1026 [Dehalococcoidia bacterium]|nr:hypothetical protein [Dehalococcoidia bacterium]